MKFRLLRNATLKLDIAGRTVLIDPFFAPKGSRPSLHGRAPNPMVELPVSVDEILDGVELVVVSHLHADHFDPVAHELVPKHLPLICQPGDEDKIRSWLSRCHAACHDTRLAGHRLSAARRQPWSSAGRAEDGIGDGIHHHARRMSRRCTGPATPCSILRSEAIIRDSRPDLIVIHACGAKWDGDLIVMDAAEAAATCRSRARGSGHRDAYGRARSCDREPGRSSLLHARAGIRAAAASDPTGWRGVEPGRWPTQIVRASIPRLPRHATRVLCAIQGTIVFIHVELWNSPYRAAKISLRDRSEEDESALINRRDFSLAGGRSDDRRSGGRIARARRQQDAFASRSRRVPAI